MSSGPDAAPLILTARLDDATQAHLDALRAAHFPRERNHLAAHLTLFHHLDPEHREAIETVLADAARGLPLAGALCPPRSLGHGVAFDVACPELVALRARMAERIPGERTRQDASWARPHVTVQNRVPAERAAALLQTLTAAHEIRPLQIVGLRLYRYLGGPWASVARFPAET